LLQTHGIKIEKLSVESKVEVERFNITELKAHNTLIRDIITILSTEVLLRIP